MSFNSLLSQIKEQNQDFEWYPTDAKILEVIKNRIKEFCYGGSYPERFNSFLDIGAGNGKVLQYFKESELFSNFYGIEKSSILINEWGKNFLLLGCNFDQTTLLDKKVDTIFCNPPYKHYEEWVCRIIKESSARLVYLVIPERWRNNQEINLFLKNRKCSTEVIYSFDFENSEDRTARAKVEVIEIKFENWREKSPFNNFFEENFKYPKEPIKINFEEKIKNTQLVNSSNLVETLDFLYQKRMKELWDSYTAICNLDYELLKEFELTKESLIKSLEMKINSVKKEFWQRLFDGMKSINSRLTKSSRQGIVDLMNSHTGIEFNRENAYAIVLWIIKNCNEYFDKQFLETYGKLIEFANVESYKSNQRVFTKDQFSYWNRYNRESAEYYKLKTGNRIVLEHCGGLSNTSWLYDKGLSQSAQDFIGDLLTIANNLNFIPENKVIDYKEWDDSGARNFYCNYKNERRLLFSVRAYKNGNMHFSFDNDFIHVLNITHGKLKGWIPNTQTAAEETTDEIAKDYFDYSFKIEPQKLMLQ